MYNNRIVKSYKSITSSYVNTLSNGIILIHKARRQQKFPYLW